MHVIEDRREVENANLTAAVSSLPTILSISQSSIPGAGFGVFSNSQIEKGVRFGPYKGKKTGWEHITSETNTSYMWEVEYSFFPLGAVDMSTSSPLNLHWTFRGEGVRESQDLDVRVGNLGQNQNNVLKKKFYLC